MFYMYNKLLNLALNIALRYRRHAERKTQLLELYTLKICIKCMIIPEIWATPKGGLCQMQSFWFFVPHRRRTASQKNWGGYVVRRAVGKALQIF